MCVVTPTLVALAAVSAGTTAATTIYASKSAAGQNRRATEAQATSERESRAQEERLQAVRDAAAKAEADAERARVETARQETLAFDKKRWEELNAQRQAIFGSLFDLMKGMPQQGGGRPNWMPTSSAEKRSTASGTAVPTVASGAAGLPTSAAPASAAPGVPTAGVKPYAMMAPTQSQQGALSLDQLLQMAMAAKGGPSLVSSGMQRPTSAGGYSGATA